MKKFLFTLAALLIAGPAMAQDTTSLEAPLPRSMASPFRIIPVAGASSFTTGSTVDVDNFGDGFSAGLYADFGQQMFTFETGILTLSSRGQRVGDQASINVDTWGVPLLAKVNFSGKPHETIFLKAGAMPFTAAEATDFDLMGVAGVGGHIPLGRNSSLLIEGTYNRLFTSGGDLTDYQGITLLGGLSLNI